MKHFLPFLLAAFLAPTSLFASHEFGGEITWECQSSGEVVFYLTIYRDCQGVALPASKTLHMENNPNLTTIPVNVVSQEDVSPSCAGGQGPSCSSGTPGSFERVVYASAPLQLTGVPGVAGWDVYYSNCCRNGASTNVPGAGMMGITLHAKMLPVNGQSMFPCFDSSPEFVRDPLFSMCPGVSNASSFAAYDADLDSLSYDFAEPYQGVITSFNPPSDPIPAPFDVGYTYDDPMPGTTTLDPETGHMTFTGNTQGGFIHKVKVTSWRNGQPVSEIYRDVMVTVMACSASSATVQAPFTGGTYNVTVVAGSPVSINLVAHNPGDSVALSAAGGMFADDFATLSLCDFPDCAVVTPIPNSSGYSLDSVNADFSWQTNTSHLRPDGEAYTHVFVFTVSDDQCPIPGEQVLTLAVTVLPAPVLGPTAQFSPTPNPACVGAPVAFTNTSVGSGALQYAWNFGDGSISTLENPSHSFSAPGIYTVQLVVADSLGSDTIVDTLVVQGAVNAGFSYAANLLEVTFSDASAGGPDYWEWHMGDGNTIVAQNPVYSYMQEGSYEVCQIVANACFNDTSCQTIVVFDSDSVWPGDANNDGTVDVVDLLPLGLGFGTNGPQRLSTSIVWQPWASLEWSQNFTVYDNYKFADCNGDGIINLDDTMAVSVNYLQVQAKGQMPASTAGVDPLLYLDVQQDSVGLSSLFTTNIMLGDAALQASNIYGVAFTVNYDPALVDSTTIMCNASGSWLGTSGTDLVFMKKAFYDQGAIDIGITRIDQQSVSGFGKIFEMGGITADNLSGKGASFASGELVFTLSNVHMISETGAPVPFSVASDTLVVVDTSTVGLPAVEAVQLSVQLFPNPVSSNVVVHISDPRVVGQLLLHNAVGQLVAQQKVSGSKTILDCSDLPQGTYLLTAQSTTGQVVVKRLTIVR